MRLLVNRVGTSADPGWADPRSAMEVLPAAGEGVQTHLALHCSFLVKEVRIWTLEAASVDLVQGLKTVDPSGEDPLEANLLDLSQEGPWEAAGLWEEDPLGPVGANPGGPLVVNPLGLLGVGLLDLSEVDLLGPVVANPVGASLSDPSGVNPSEGGPWEGASVDQVLEVPSCAD